MSKKKKMAEMLKNVKEEPEMSIHPWKCGTGVNRGHCIMQLGVWGCITLNVKYVKVFIKNVTKKLKMSLKILKYQIECQKCQNFNKKCQKCHSKILKCQMSKTLPLPHFDSITTGLFESVLV